jgi:hypothetical protein
MLGTTLNTLIDEGFNLSHVEEFAPTREQVKQSPELAEELERPMMLLVSARKIEEGVQHACIESIERLAGDAGEHDVLSKTPSSRSRQRCLGLADALTTWFGPAEDEAK